MKCPKCGYKNRDDEVFCVGCGIEMKTCDMDVSKLEPCPNCGQMNAGDAKFCQKCGTNLRLFSKSERRDARLAEWARRLFDVFNRYP